ncbi:MAG: phosphatase PAP2 family protein [Oscillospiraceae bacterium]|nr:phosphatase PAP2 family protein [Oscillospiraceae bacterium]
MKKGTKREILAAAGFIAAFAVWTAAVRFVDVRAIGPQGSLVGFATMNAFVHKLTGVHMSLYTITDWLGLVPLGVALAFAIMGLCQRCRRKHILKVDYSILALGVYYIVVMAVYILFEIVEINYRPILINGYLEASYPSSTTMLVMCVMPTAIMQLNWRIKNSIVRKCVAAVIVVFIAFMVIGRLLSGVHWFSDIVGGALLSIGLVMMYRAVSGLRMK